jgi:hypothetical protein
MASSLIAPEALSKAATLFSSHEMQKESRKYISNLKDA